MSQHTNTPSSFTAVLGTFLMAPVTPLGNLAQQIPAGQAVVTKKVNLNRT